MHNPHSPDRYRSLMQRAYAIQKPIALGKLHGVMLGFLKASDAERVEDADFLEGELFRFVKIDMSLPWFNAVTLREATEDEVTEISIPEHLLPNLQRLQFVFNVKRHRLFYISKDRDVTLGPGTAERFFQQLFDIVREGRVSFPPITVTAVPDSDSIDTILSIHKLKKLRIELSVPNPDDGEEDEERFRRRLEKQKARKQVTELYAESGKGLKPDQETISLARVAAENGFVRGEGNSEEGTKVIENTKNTPEVKIVKINEDAETTMQVLRRYAGELLRRT
ncbi:DUF4747 family protein [uncultured Pseudacidovorax sp.]|uniref:DUF4747 family protein n=1 Tax=uncultured Pseudacidovorax sp. TaxID=679313 RepID=UPI0025D42BFD|nr:DUF4747 family protein [uncultured Pseudacidovorax sp.]